MKSKIHLKLLMAPLSMLTLFACSPNQFQQVSEYDDVYFTSADRKQAPKIVTKPEEAPSNFSEVLTLENKSQKTLDENLINKYNNGTPAQEVEYFVEGEVGPKVEKASQLNYKDFVWDYENEMLATYTLPLDWETEWDEFYFNDLIRNDFEFRLAWYDQYYVGNSDRMDRYINASNGRIGNASAGNFTRPRVNVNIGYVARPAVGISFGFGPRFYDPFFYDPFFNDPFIYSSFYDPFYVGSIWRWDRWNRRRSRWRFGGFYDPYFYCPPIFSNQYIYRGDVIVARNNRTYTRGGRLRSTSVTSVRSDANRGVTPTRSERLSSTNGTRNLTRSTVASRPSRNGRVSSSSTRSNTSTRSSRNTNTVTSTRSNRVSTDAYRFDGSNNRRSSETRLNASNGRSRQVVSTRTSRNPRSSSYNRTSTNRSSSSRNSSRVSFNRSSSRSSSGVRSSSSRSSSSRGYSRSSSSRSRSSSGVSRSSSSSSRSRSSGSVSRSSSSSSRSSSGGRGGSSSRSGRRN